VYAHFGIQLPRVTYNQIQVGASVPTDKLQPGDLVFFDTEPKKGADHVGIYIGGGKFIHAPHTGDVVKISSLSDSYYMNRLMATRRISGVAGASMPTADGSGRRRSARSSSCRPMSWPTSTA
jgi:cell wall-associated NlpC family hydrolase